eukprot:7294427-Heterocapsa_arctica.AAC.1
MGPAERADAVRRQPAARASAVGPAETHLGVGLVLAVPFAAALLALGPLDQRLPRQWWEPSGLGIPGCLDLLVVVVPL